MNGNSLDFDQVYEQYFQPIRRYITRLVGESDAEDLTQEIFIKVHNALPAFRGESKITTWIYRIATNTALDKLRSPAKKFLDQEAPLDEAETNTLESQTSITPSQKEFPSIEQQLFQKERQDCFQEYIHNLPLNYRMVVALSELGGLLVNEISEILGVNVSTVKIRLHRGRTRLLLELKAHCRPEDWL